VRRRVERRRQEHYEWGERRGNEPSYRKASRQAWACRKEGTNRGKKKGHRSSLIEGSAPFTSKRQLGKEKGKKEREVSRDQIKRGTSRKEPPILEEGKGKRRGGELEKGRKRAYFPPKVETQFYQSLRCRERGKTGHRIPKT